MKRTRFFKTALFAAAALLMYSSTQAQGDKSSRPSPPATATGTAAGSTITISYSSPAVKGRKIWGGLVPYDKVWRAGANEATIFETSKPIKIEGKSLPAGKYSLFATPGETEWTIILNSETGQWGIKRDGDANRDPAKDVVTVKVKPKKLSSSQERLTYEVKSPGFVLNWEYVSVPVSIK
ncbi:MAG TPA: DUF2911 domain-containing protein [Puia sp.]|nr:DUF2911 domain-containing protein [Puia sp.]